MGWGGNGRTNILLQNGGSYSPKNARNQSHRYAAVLLRDGWGWCDYRNRRLPYSYYASALEPIDDGSTRMRPVWGWSPAGSARRTASLAAKDSVVWCVENVALAHAMQI